MRTPASPYDAPNSVTARRGKMMLDNQSNRSEKSGDTVSEINKQRRTTV